MGALRSFSQANCSIALSLTNNERFARKPDERIPKPDFCERCNDIKTLFMFVSDECGLDTQKYYFYYFYRVI